MKIVVTGSIAYDYLMSFPGKFSDHLLADQLHNISLSFLVDKMKRQRGGTAPNIAYNLALLGGSPTIMATAGQDFTEYRQWLEEHKVNTSAIQEIADDYCASFFVNTDEEQNQIASFYTGAMAHAHQLRFSNITEKTDLAIVSPNDPTAMNNYVNECKASKIPYIYDPSQQTVRLSGEDLLNGLTGCAILTLNEYEFNLIQEKTGLNEEEILAKVDALLVTKGGDGSLFIKEGIRYEIPVVAPDKIVDPTGAGDAYRGGLMRGIQLGLPWDTACRIGALASTYVLEQLGTQSHHYSIPEFITRYRKHFSDDGELNRLMS